MKSVYSILATLAVISTAVPSISHAAGQMLAECSTADGQYQILVGQTPETGLTRTLSLWATIKNSGGIVAQYAVQTPHIVAIGFGTGYQDIASSGADFSLIGPSTNPRGYTLSAKTPDGKIVDNNLKCSMFGGHFVN